MLCVPGKEQDDDEDEDDSKKKKKKKEKSYLPHWVIYIGYVLVFFASGTSAFFVILYGFSFGKTKSEQWIQTMMLSFWQSVLIVQPIKVGKACLAKVKQVRLQLFTLLIITHHKATFLLSIG